MATVTNWKKRAKELEKEGFVPGNPWEQLFLASLKRARPELAKELGADLPHYARVQGALAQKRYEALTEQGTPPETARELALADLLASLD
jgi:hypothetical protein